MTYTTCLECGELAEGGPHCREHAPRDTRPVRRDLTQVAWRSLSRRARAAQPWCQLCGSTERLAADHSPRAWSRMSAGLLVRLCDVSVVCASCNNQLGSSRKGTNRWTRWRAVDGDLNATTPDPTLGGGGAGRLHHPGARQGGALSAEGVRA